MSISSILAQLLLALGICQVAQAEEGRRIARVTEARTIDVVSYDEGLLIDAIKLIDTCERRTVVGAAKAKNRLFELTAYRDLIATRSLTVFRYVEPIQDDPFSRDAGDGLRVQMIAEITIVDVNPGLKRIFAYTERGDLLEYHSPSKEELESLLAKVASNRIPNRAQK